MKKLALACALAMGLVGCSEPPVKTEEGYRQYKILSVKPPKRFRVEVQDVETKQVFDLYVRKRCSTWRTTANNVGEETALMTHTATYADGSTRVYIESGVLCPNS